MWRGVKYTYRGVGTGPADPAGAGPIFCQNPQSKVFGY